jgi:hypothetical protein
VQQAQRSGAVLQEIAQRHGLHPSLLTRWRAEHRIGMLGKEAVSHEARLLPVQVRRSSRPSVEFAGRVPGGESSAKLGGAIEVEFSAGQRLCIRGAVDAQTLRTVLQELSQS